MGVLRMRFQCHIPILRAIAILGALLMTAASPAAEESAAPAKAGAIRQIDSQHLTLFTDLPPSAEVDALPGIFDQAFPQWCAYFGVDPKEHADWKLQGYLMKARERFEAAGMVPADLPNFLNGYSRGKQFWLYDQTSPYYRRHLLLHEGTHAFMDTLGHGRGAPWFAEGMAELLATHRLENGQLELNYFPRDRNEVSKWGRIEIVQTRYAARRAMSLETIFDFNGRAFLENDPYGWSWAVAAFFDGHPKYRERFRRLHSLAGEKDMGVAILQTFADEWREVTENWQLFVANLDYGYDFGRLKVELAPGKPLTGDKTIVTVATDRGWQSSGVQLEPGAKYRLRAKGRYQLDDQPQVLWCEPGGVTIHYYRGQPLGILQAAIRSDDPNQKGPSGLLKPIVVGLETTLEAPHGGTLYFRINDAPGSLADNVGSLSVEIVRE